MLWHNSQLRKTAALADVANTVIRYTIKIRLCLFINIPCYLSFVKVLYRILLFFGFDCWLSRLERLV
jgi:hypothetical protein